MEIAHDHLALISDALARVQTLFESGYDVSAAFRLSIGVDISILYVSYYSVCTSAIAVASF